MQLQDAVASRQANDFLAPSDSVRNIKGHIARGAHEKHIRVDSLDYSAISHRSGNNHVISQSSSTVPIASGAARMMHQQFNSNDESLGYV